MHKFPINFGSTAKNWKEVYIYIYINGNEIFGLFVKKFNTQVSQIRPKCYIIIHRDTKP
jgi:hypothetical protein